MKFLKKLLLVIASLVVLILIIALFLNNNFSVSRSIELNKGKSEVFEYVKYLKNQDDFSVWANLDPEMKKSYSGTDGEVGFTSKWSSNNKEVGRGEQEILKIQKDDRIDYELRFKEPYESTNKASFEFKSITENKTQVIWRIEGRMAWPWNFTLLFMNMEELVGPDLEKGLENLKFILEEKNNLQ